MINKPLVVPLLLVFLSSCGLLGLNITKEYPDPIPAASAVSFDFESDFEAWIALGGSGESATDPEDSNPDDDIRLAADPLNSGNQTARFRITSESYVANGIRAELTFDAHQREGETGMYRWKVLIPIDYSDVRIEDSEGAPNWQLMGQWHQQPVWFAGETWDRFQGQGESPAIGINYYFIDQSDPSYQQEMASDPQVLEVHGFDASWDQQPVFLLTYGTPPLPIAFYPIEKGRWIELELTIEWSQGPDGSVLATIDGAPFTNGVEYGANMWNRESQYFKFGLYRNPNILPDQTVYYDDFAYTPVY